MESTGDRDPAGRSRHHPEERGQKSKTEAQPGPVDPRTWLRYPVGVRLVTRQVTEADPARLVPLAIKTVGILDRTFSWREFDLVDAHNAIVVLDTLAQKGKCVDKMVQNGVIPALVKHLQAPPSGEGDRFDKFHQHVVEKMSACALGWLALKRIVPGIRDYFSEALTMLTSMQEAAQQSH